MPLSAFQLCAIYVGQTGQLRGREREEEEEEGVGVGERAKGSAAFLLWLATFVCLSVYLRSRGLLFFFCCCRRRLASVSLGVGVFPVLFPVCRWSLLLLLPLLLLLLLLLLLIHLAYDDNI